MICAACIAEQLGGELLSHPHTCGQPAPDLPGPATNPDARGRAGEPRCYQPNLAHGNCLAGHPTHLDVDHYDTPRWVHCTIADLITCPAEMSDLTGDYVGKHRVTP